MEKQIIEGNGQMLKKGEAPPAYYAGALEPYNFKNLSKEQMREINRKSAVARR